MSTAPDSAALAAAATAADQDHPPTTKKERVGWYMYDFANSAISSVAISGFLPLLVQDLALTAAGMPNICPNYIGNATLVQAVFPGSSATGMYAYNDPASDAILPSSGCAFGTVPYNGTWCPGAPPSSDQCLDAGGDPANVYALSVTLGGRSWNPNAYASTMISISTGLQMFFFITVGGVSDWGGNRKRVLTALSLAGSLVTILCIAVTQAAWWSAGIMLILIGILYNASFVAYNSWLPSLAACDPAVLASTPGAPRETAFLAAMDRLSSTGFATGYAGSVLCLLICVAITFALSDDSTLAYRVNLLVSGLWWLAFSMFTFAWLRPRPGPPLPKGENYVTLPWKQLWRTLSRATHLPRTFAYLLLYFVYSDGFNVVSSVGILYANSSVIWTISKSLGLAGLLVVVPIAAGIGNVFFQWVSTRWGVLAKRIVVLNCWLIALVPAYGLLGFASRSLGYRLWWEMYIAVIFYGFNLGAVQAFSRSIMGALIPDGLESQFFALWAFTDRGSSWIGPAVVAAVIQSTGTIRLAFVYPLVALLVPSTLLLLFIDVRAGEHDARAYAAHFHTAAGSHVRGAFTAEDEAAGAEAGAAGGTGKTVGGDDAGLPTPSETAPLEGGSDGSSAR